MAKYSKKKRTDLCLLIVYPKFQDRSHFILPHSAGSSHYRVLVIKHLRTLSTRQKKRGAGSQQGPSNTGTSPSQQKNAEMHQTWRSIEMISTEKVRSVLIASTGSPLYLSGNQAPSLSIPQVERQSAGRQHKPNTPERILHSTIIPKQYNCQWATR